MKRQWIIGMGLWLVLSVSGGAEEVKVKEADEKPTVLLDLEVRQVSWFKDVPARVAVQFPAGAELEESEVLPRDSETLLFLRQEWSVSGTGESAQQELDLLLMPREAGRVLIPALIWEGAQYWYQTRPQQVFVDQLKASDQMQLQVTPASQQVYVGQPMKVDVVWSSTLPAATLRQLSFTPTFMQHPTVEADIPRLDIADDQRVGVPVGGRRVIAQREVQEGERQLGQVSFPVFLRFTETGAHTFEETRLKLFRVAETNERFAPYAAYFNNKLFEPLEPGKRSEYLYTTVAGFVVKVLPLPIPKSDGDKDGASVFTGWFMPCGVKAEVDVQAGEVGQLMELSLRVTTAVASAMVDAPDLRLQRGLRYRFWVEAEPRKIWHPDGVEFLFRFRPLTSKVQAFPALSFQVFNPQTGSYQFLQTPALPLKVTNRNGETFFKMEATQAQLQGLESQPAGIWHNRQGSRIEDSMNSIVNSLADGFWIWILGICAVTAAAVPWVKERRRRAVDPVYRRQVEAYAAYRKAAASASANPTEQAQAFRSFLAEMTQKSAAALTVGDVMEWMQSEPGLDEKDQDLQTVRDWFEAEDAQHFDPKASDTTASLTDGLARRIFHQAGRGRK